MRKSLQEVQQILLRWYAENDLPRVIWSDNGGQFRSVVADAIESTLGVQARYIPPGHPQSNGLVEMKLGRFWVTFNTFWTVVFPTSILSTLHLLNFYIA